MMFILIAENKTLKTKRVVAMHLSVDMCVNMSVWAPARRATEARAARSFNIGFTNKENYVAHAPI
jgi:hypothetical protein